MTPKCEVRYRIGQPIVTAMRLQPAIALIATPAFGDPPIIEQVRYLDGSIAVTLSHPDTGWDHYADGWRVGNPDGDILATRILAHPHVNEQPFTRSMQVDLPADLTEVFIRASCNVDGWAEDVIAISLR